MTYMSHTGLELACFRVLSAGTTGDYYHPSMAFNVLHNEPSIVHFMISFEDVLSLCGCARECECQKRKSSPPDLDLQTVVSHPE